MISVIVNVYNCEKYIQKCLESIINQTYKDLEILIINDGSTDGTLEICQSYKDKRIKIITTANQGLSLSRNTGINNAMGEYLYFIDADDYIEPDTIDYLYALIKKYDVEIATCGWTTVRNNKFKKNGKKKKSEIITSKDFLKKILFNMDGYVAAWNKLAKRELFEGLRFENRKQDDLLFTHKQIMRIEKMAYGNECKYYYVKHNESICAKGKDDADWNIGNYLACLERHDYIKKTYPDFPENDVGLMLRIERLYLRNNDKILAFLKKSNAFQLYKELFSLKLMKCDLGQRDKIKLILFRINPSFHNFVVESYLKLSGKTKW